MLLEKPLIVLIVKRTFGIDKNRQRSAVIYR
jgi:hypothetical protein